MTNARWQHWVNFAAGSWLFASPWFLDYLYHPVIAAADSLVVGAGMILCSLLALQFEDMDDSVRGTLVLGAWALLSPWVLRFSAPAMIAANMVGVGSLVLLMSAWVICEERPFIQWRRHRRRPA